MVSQNHFYLALIFFLGSSMICAHGLLKTYVSLISDVHKYYGTSSVFFMSSNRNQHIQEYTLVHVLSREFSRKGVLTLIINFDELTKRTAMYRDRVVRPLIVVMLTAVSGIEEFSENTREMNMSYPIWLVIFADEFGEPVCEYCNRPMRNLFRLRFNTEMLVVCCRDPLLKEWWSVRKNETEMAVFGQWTQDDGFTLLTKKGLYARRHEINGTGLRIVVVRNSAFLDDDEKDKIGGYFGTVLMELQRVMNFTITAMIKEDGFGSWNSVSKSWSGAISHVADSGADFGVAEFTITNRRLDAVDFTLPLIITRQFLYVKEPDGSGVQWSAYFEAFTHQIWMTIIVLMFTTPVLLTLIKMKTGCKSLTYLFFENYLYVWGIFCQQGLAEFPAETPLRIAYFSIFVSALVVSAAYSASLISFLTVSTTSLPFTNMEGFAKDGSYRLIVLQNSSDYDLFTTSGDPVLTKMKMLLKPWSYLPSNMLDGFKKVCKDKVAFYLNEAMVKTMNIYMPCKIIPIETGRTESLAMIMSAESQYTGVVNYHIQRFQDNGMMNRLKQKYLIKPIPAETTHSVVSLWGVAPILSVLAGGILLAFFVLFCEKCCNALKDYARKYQRAHSQRTNIHRWFDVYTVQRTTPENLRLPPRWQTNNLNDSLARYHR